MKLPTETLMEEVQSVVSDTDELESLEKKIDANCGILSPSSFAEGNKT